jgi:hypothetical protein
MLEAIPFRDRKIDWFFVGFFAINFAFITYVVDLEQLVIADPNRFEYPLWPPAPLVDLVHWWGRSFDPPQWNRPVWWRATIWIDVLLFGPFYAAAIYAFVRGREWIRKLCFLWAPVMMTNVTIIMFEELIGPHRTPAPGIVTMANFPWFVIPTLVIARVWKDAPLFHRVRA